MLLLLLAFPVHALQFGSSGSAGEVYGATGRIGSLLLRSGAGKLAAVPRGLAPGCLSPPGTPILVTAPTDALADVLRATPPQRQPDLVLLCNGAARERVADVLGEAAAARITAGCLFFGVLAPGASPTHGAGAPRTALAGPHAAATAELIERMGPRCEVTPQASHSPLPARSGGLSRAVISRATCSWLGACAAARPRTLGLRRSRGPPAPRHAWRHPQPWATACCPCVVW
jgi:hypothetical protein